MRAGRRKRQLRHRERTDGGHRPRPGVTIALFLPPDVPDRMGMWLRLSRVPQVLHRVDVTNLRPVRIPPLDRTQVHMPRTVVASTDGTEASGSACDTRRFAHSAARKPRKHGTFRAERGRACPSTVELRNRSRARNFVNDVGCQPR